jgi:hypothetical protein
MIARDKVGDPPFSVGFRFGADEYLAVVDSDGIAVARGAEAQGDIGFTGAPNALAALIYGDVPLAELVGQLAARGDPALAARFAALFTLPPKFIPGPA